MFSMTAMFIHWLLLIDMAVFATKLSAFVLVVKHVLSEARCDTPSRKTGDGMIGMSW